tara:strand:- start:667 stop:888 length:222 start_codon:yes stop_codon:yes gene_type:complete
MIDNIQKIIDKVMQDNNWGLYFKATPLENLPSQDGQHIYKVNDVSSEELATAIRIAVEDFLDREPGDVPFSVE